MEDIHCIFQKAQPFDAKQVFGQKNCVAKLVLNLFLMIFFSQQELFNTCIK